VPVPTIRIGDDLGRYPILVFNGVICGIVVILGLSYSFLNAGLACPERAVQISSGGRFMAFAASSLAFAFASTENFDLLDKSTNL
jgi:hypothetical protein